MRRWWVVAVLLAGCGRIGFDPFGAGSDGGTGDVGGGDGANGDSIMVDAGLPSGLFAHYPLDDTLPGSAKGRDISGNNRHMVCMVPQICPTNAPGRGTAMAARFDGTNDQLTWTPAGTEANFATFSVLAWVYVERRPSIVEIFVGRPVGAAGQNSFAVSQIASGRTEYFTEGNSSLFGMSVLALSTWRHVAITWDGTFKRIYVDGLLEGSASQGAVLTYDAHPLIIGADIENGVDSFFFQGRIADVMIYSRTLSDAEVEQISKL